MESWLTLITDVGFPIVVTFYLLHRIETKMNLLIDSINELPKEIHKANTKESSESNKLTVL